MKEENFVSHVGYVYYMRTFKKVNNTGGVREGSWKVPFLTVAYVAVFNELEQRMEYGVGISACSDKDMPCKKIGKTKAIGRALGALEYRE